MIHQQTHHNNQQQLNFELGKPIVEYDSDSTLDSKCADSDDEHDADADTDDWVADLGIPSAPREILSIVGHCMAEPLE